MPRALRLASNTLVMPRQLATSAADFLPERKTLPNLREAAQHCKGCDLWKRATQGVFGEGSPGAEVMLVGEQPGDQEDLQGRPLVASREAAGQGP